MNPATILTLLALSTPAHPHERHDDDRGGGRERPTETCAPAVVAAFDQLDDTLRHLDEELAQMRGRPAQREHLREDLVESVRAAQAARITSCRASRQTEVVVVAPPPPSRPAIELLDDASAHALTQAVRREAFDSERLGILELGVRDTCVTSTQARDFVQQMTFSRPRLDAVRLLAPRIVDRQRSFILLETMTFDSDKRAARDILSTSPPSPLCTDLRG